MPRKYRVKPETTRRRKLFILRWPPRRVVSAMLFQHMGKPLGVGHYEYVLECGHEIVGRSGRYEKRTIRCRACYKKIKRSARDKRRYAARKQNENTAGNKDRVAG